MGKSEIKTRSSAGILIAVIIGILIIVNLISINLFSRADLTDGQIYSLSESSKALIGDLNDRLTIKAFITQDLPAPHNGDARYLKDLLDDYKAYSGGYLHYEFIDPVKDGKEDEAMSFRIPPLQFNVFKNEKTEFIKGFKGIALIYGDKIDILPFIENTSNLEYDLSRAINKLTQTEIPTVAFTNGHGEPDMATNLTWANQLLQKEYRVQFLNLANLRKIPEQVKVLVIAAPVDSFNIWEIYLVDQFVMRGGKVAFLIDKFNINIQQTMVMPAFNGLDSLMYHYGASVRDRLVIDLQCNMVPVMRDMGQFQMQSVVNYPFYLSIGSFNKDNPIVKSMKSFNLLFASPLDFSPDIRADLDRQWLFASSEHSGLRGIPIDISPEKKYMQEDFDQPNQPLAATMTGHLESYFKDKPVPLFSGTDTIRIETTPDKIDFVDDARIVVVGSGSFIKDDNRRNSTGYIILMNIVDWLTQEKGLISIRSKQAVGSTLEVVSDETKKIVKYINMLAMPIVVVIFGLARWQFKRARRRADKE